MNVCIVGAGYVGLVSGVCFAELGNNVTCVDIDKSKVDMINKAKAPIFEKGLEDLLRKHVGKKLNATSHLPQAAEVIFICVGTPSHGHCTHLRLISSK